MEHTGLQTLVTDILSDFKAFPQRESTWIILGVIVGPVIAGRFGTQSLFWLTGALGLATVWLLARHLPEIPPRQTAPAPLREVLRHRSVLALDFGGFLMNTFMTSFWFYFSLIVTGRHGLKMTEYDTILVPMLLVSAVTMFAFSAGADRGWGRTLAAAAFLILLVSALLLFRPATLGLDPKRLSAVRWGVAGRVVWAWVLTIPGTAAVAALCYWAMGLLR